VEFLVKRIKKNGLNKKDFGQSLFGKRKWIKQERFRSIPNWRIALFAEKKEIGLFPNLTESVVFLNRPF
jgi:hypothetical protein